jgi:hypothetical protein
MTFVLGVLYETINGQALPTFPIHCLIRPSGPGTVPWKTSRPTVETIGSHLLDQSIF